MKEPTGACTLTPEPERVAERVPEPAHPGELRRLGVRRVRTRTAGGDETPRRGGGPGNAVADVSVTGLPLSGSEEVRSARVRVTNPTDEAVFYAVKVEFVDAEDKVLTPSSSASSDAPPDRTVDAQANSRKAAGVKTFVAQAERG